MKKQYILIIALSAALLLIVTLPIVFIKMDTGYKLNEVELFSVETNFYQKPAKEYDLWEQIKIFQNASVMWESKLNDYIPEDKIEKTEAELIREMEDQLKAIQSYNGLPELHFSDVEHSSIRKETFMNTENKEYAEILDLWAIRAVYREFTVSAYMDSQTFALYDVFIMSANDKFIYTSDITEDGFWKYLNSFTALGGAEDVMYCVHDAYRDREIHLYLISENSAAEQKSFYCFHTPVDINSPISPNIHDISGSESYVIVDKKD